MGVILLKIQGEMSIVGSASHCWMRGTKHRLEQLLTRCGFQSVSFCYGALKMVLPHV